MADSARNSAFFAGWRGFVGVGAVILLGALPGCRKGDAGGSPGPDASTSTSDASAAASGGATVEGTRDAAATDNPDGSASTGIPASVCGEAVLRDCFGELETLAGTALQGQDGVNDWNPAFEGGPAVDAELSRPHMAMRDAQGNVYIADKDGHAIRRVTLDGIITTVAGTGTPGDDGDEPGPATERRLWVPNGLYVLPDGTLYILDLGNSKLRRSSPDGEVTTVFTYPALATGRGLWVSDDETLAYVSSGREILRWTPSDGVETFATGFTDLGNLTVDARGRVLATDRALGSLFAVNDAGQLELLAGGGVNTGDTVPALEARLGGLRAVAVDDRGGAFLGLHDGSAVKYLDANGWVHHLLGATDVSEVRAVTWTAEYGLLITEHDGGRIRALKRR